MLSTQYCYYFSVLRLGFRDSVFCKVTINKKSLWWFGLGCDVATSVIWQVFCIFWNFSAHGILIKLSTRVRSMRYIKDKVESSFECLHSLQKPSLKYREGRNINDMSVCTGSLCEVIFIRPFIEGKRSRDLPSAKVIDMTNSDGTKMTEMVR